MNERHFLPTTKKELEALGIDRPDFVYVIGDAYVDHPSFGPAIISRVLEAEGYSVAILAQPDWRDESSIQALGAPRLGFLVSAGNMDSMVNHFTVNKKRRSRDAYSPGGKTGLRPDRAVTVYCNLIRRVFGHVPIIIGGIEASLRRMAHYDYWKDQIRRSVLLDAQADILSYGMGERSIVEIADGLRAGLPVDALRWIPGTVIRCRDLSEICDYILLPSFQEISSPDPAGKKAFCRSFMIQYENTDPFHGKRLAEPYGEHEFVVQNPPQPPLSQEEMDRVYSLPYVGSYHPVYEKDGGVPAIEEIRFSLTANRGCFGGCNFCALAFHQGRIVQARSADSLLEEARRFTEYPDFKGIISDVGGPTANFRLPACRKQLTAGVCRDRQCLTPTPCKNLIADHREYMDLLKRLQELPGIKRVFVRSGIRFDYVMYDRKNRDAFIARLCRDHTSGQLRVAPEHVCDSVLRLMGKPGGSVYEAFAAKCGSMNERLHKKQYVVPYLMSSHPGSGLREAIRLAEYVRDLGYMPEQVQDFYPTPSTISTCMYYTGMDPRTGEKVYVPRSPREKAMQRALIQYRDPANYDLVREALEKGHRRDLIGFGPRCLIRPRRLARETESKKRR